MNLQDNILEKLVYFKPKTFNYESSFRRLCEAYDFFDLPSKDKYIFGKELLEEERQTGKEFPFIVSAQRKNFELISKWKDTCFISHGESEGLGIANDLQRDQIPEKISLFARTVVKNKLALKMVVYISGKDVVTAENLWEDFKNEEGFFSALTELCKNDTMTIEEGEVKLDHEIKTATLNILRNIAHE